jgi:hypothetical protein
MSSWSGSGPGSTPLVWSAGGSICAAIGNTKAVRAAIQARLAPGRTQAACRRGPAPDPRCPLPPGCPRGGPRLAEARLRPGRAQRLCHRHRRPGTGKTTTVVRLLALLQALALADQPGAAPPLRIRLAAPTGKAAARLNESIAGAVARLIWPDCPTASGARRHSRQVTTLHRLLGSRPIPATSPPRRQPAGRGCAGGGRSLDGRSGDDGRRARRPAARAPASSCSATRTSSPRWRPGRCSASCAARGRGHYTPDTAPGWPARPASRSTRP